MFTLSNSQLEVEFELILPIFFQTREALGASFPGTDAWNRQQSTLLYDYIKGYQKAIIFLQFSTELKTY